MSIVTYFMSRCLLFLLIVNQIFSFPAWNLFDRNREAKTLLAKQVFEKYKDFDELKDAAINETVDAWIAEERECTRADAECARADRAEQNLNETIKKVGNLEIEKDTLTDENRFYKMLMGIRNRIDVLLQHLWPRDVPYPSSRYFQIMVLLIIGQKNYYVQQLRNLIHDWGMTFEQFAKYAQSVYRDDANQPIHTIRVPPCTADEIEAACKAAKVEIGDDITRSMLHVIFEKLNITRADNGTALIPTNEPDSTYRCLLLSNILYNIKNESDPHKQKPSPETLVDQSINKKIRKSFFDKYVEDRQLIENIERWDEQINEPQLPNTRSFLVKFYRMTDAVEVFLKHIKHTLDSRNIDVSLRSCEDVNNNNPDTVIRKRFLVPKAAMSEKNDDDDDEGIGTEKSLECLKQ